MPRMPAEIWEDLNNSINITSELQEEMNEAIAEPPDPEPEPTPGPYQYGKLPTADQIIQCSEANQIRDALAAARPGTRIEVTSREYGGDFTLSTNGEPNKPIMIHAPQGATFLGKFQIPGHWNGLSGITFKNNGRKIDISGRGGRVLRCTFPNIQYDGMIYLTGDSHPDAMLDFNLFQNIKGAAIRSEIKDSTKHKNMRIAYNYVKTHTVLGDNESVMLILTDAYDAADLVYECNRFEDCMINHESIGQKELISGKTGGIKFISNTIVRCRGGFICLRETRGCLVDSNWLRDNSYVKVHGDNHEIRNNNGIGKTIELNAGNQTFDAPLPSQCQNYSKAGRTPVIVKNGNCATAHTATRNTEVHQTIGDIIVGQGYPDMSFKCKNINLHHNKTKAQVINNSCDGFTETNIGNCTNTAYEMTAAMVGPNAPAPT